MDNKAAVDLLRTSASKLRNLAFNNVAIKEVSTDFQIAGAEEFWKLIDSLLDEQVTITQEHVLAASKNTDLNFEYLRQIYPDIDSIIQESVPDIRTYTEKFYSAGKTAGFSDMGVKAFTGAADTNAMFHLTNYNFELIRKLTDDLAAGVRQEVWQGVARDRGLKEIAKRIEKVPDLVPLQRGNRVWTIKERAKLQAHTESTRARHQGIYMSFKEYGVTKQDLINTPWERLCKLCKARAAKNPWNIEDPKGWSPIHVTCYCSNIAAEDPAEKASDPDEFLNMVTGEMQPINKALVFAI
nr:hypothetical protein [uncultured Methanobacterium sp.]